MRLRLKTIQGAFLIRHGLYGFADRRVTACLAIVLYGLGAALSQQRAFVTEKDRQRLFDDLRTASIDPQLILFDHNLRELSPGITEFFEHYYEPVGTGFIWRRKQVPHLRFQVPTSN